MEQNRKLAIRNWSVCDRPTYKLHECGASTMTDAELLSIIIGSGTAKYNALEIAKMALGKYENNLNSMGKADVESLTEIEGIGENTAIKVMAAFELGKRRQQERAKMQESVSSAVQIYNIMRPIMMDLKHEEAYLLLMNQNFRLIKTVKLSQGGIAETSVDIRIAMKHAIMNNATVAALCHNHPSNNPHPSSVDDQLTKSIKAAFQTMRIHFLDHVIICDGEYYSYAEAGKI